MNQNKITVQDPLRTIKIDGVGSTSILDIYLNERALYQEMCNSNNIYGVFISEEVKAFFRNATTRKKSAKKLRKEYVSQWKKHVEFRSARAKRVRDKEKELLYVRQIIKDTRNGTCQWKEELNTVSTGIYKMRFSAKYEGGVLKFSIVSYKNKDGEVKNNTELQRDGGNELETFPRDLNATLYSEIKKHTSLKQKRKVSTESQKLRKQEKEITSGDFVIRTNLFKCYHESHKLEEIIGLLKIVLPSGKEIVEKVPGAYCEKCHCFFMSISEYQRVKKKGVLLCQIIDHEEYHKYGKLTHFNGATESILMRCGYNVKANVGLTDLQRQMILSSIINNKIMQPHYIVSYLNTFIAQKSCLPQYKTAVDKWRRDREFVLAYENENKRNVRITKITK